MSNECRHKWSAPVEAIQRYPGGIPVFYMVISCERCGELRKMDLLKVERLETKLAQEDTHE